AIKVKADYSSEGVKRSIDQICFFDRNNKENSISIIVKDGIPIIEAIPSRILDKFKENKEIDFLQTYLEILKSSQI
ncbi:MAG: hypothetical protein Q4F12_04780, partial [Erysipelotrichaceae bacterium]|nr:hypothetical protein [Erysipelotrichaceae bacterium]